MGLHSVPHLWTVPSLCCVLYEMCEISEWMSVAKAVLWCSVLIAALQAQNICICIIVLQTNGVWH